MTQARLLTNQMWALWDNAPDESSQEMLNEGMQARAGLDYLRVLALNPWLNERHLRPVLENKVKDI